jgi:hypothetical protein
LLLPCARTFAQVGSQGMAPLLLLVEHGRYIEAEAGLREKLEADPKPTRP